MAELKVGQPLLKIGTYFQDLKGVNAIAYQKAYDAFIHCLLTLDDDEKAQYIPWFWDDVKADYLKAIAA